MAGKFEITKSGDGTFTFEFFIDDKSVGTSPVFEKEDECRRGVKAVKKNSRMKVQNTLRNDGEKTNPKYLVTADGDKVKYTLYLQTGAVALEGTADSEEEALENIEKIGNNANTAQMQTAEVVLTENEQKQIRINKLKELQSAGNDPFEITKAVQTHTALEINNNFDELEEKDVSICGRIMTWRDMGKANFIDLRDRTGRIQVYVRMNDVGEDEFKEFKKWDLGDIVQVDGFVFKTRTGEISIHAKKLILLSKSLLPLPEKFHGLTDTDTRYRKRYLDMIMNPDVKDTFIKRSKIISSIRAYLDNLGFVEVETPILNNIAGDRGGLRRCDRHDPADRVRPGAVQDLGSAVRAAVFYSGGDPGRDDRLPAVQHSVRLRGAGYRLRYAGDAYRGCGLLAAEKAEMAGLRPADRVQYGDHSVGAALRLRFRGNDPGDDGHGGGRRDPGDRRARQSSAGGASEIPRRYFQRAQDGVMVR